MTKSSVLVPIVQRIILQLSQQAAVSAQLRSTGFERLYRKLKDNAGENALSFSAKNSASIIVCRAPKRAQLMLRFNDHKI